MTTPWVVIFFHYILQRKWKMQRFGMWDLLILRWFGFPTSRAGSSAWLFSEFVDMRCSKTHSQPSGKWNFNKSTNACQRFPGDLHLLQYMLETPPPSCVIWRSIMTCIIDSVFLKCECMRTALRSIQNITVAVSFVSFKIKFQNVVWFWYKWSYWLLWFYHINVLLSS